MSAVLQTHRLVVGGKRVVQTVAQAWQVASLQADGVNVAFGAAFAPGFFGAAFNADNASIGVLAQQSAFQQLDQAIAERTETTIGGLPEVTTPHIDTAHTISALDCLSPSASRFVRVLPLCAVCGETNYYDWAASIPDRAIPIQYTLKPLPELLDGPKRLALQQAIEAYIAAAKRVSSVTYG